MISHVEHSCSCGRDSFCEDSAHDGAFEIKHYRCECGLMMEYVVVECDEAKPEETLSDKFHGVTNGILLSKAWDRAKYLAQIAKEHYQKHPEEIGYVGQTKYDNAVRYGEAQRNFFLKEIEDNKGMVSLDKVLEVYDEEYRKLYGSLGGSPAEPYLTIRKAIEDLK